MNLPSITTRRYVKPIPGDGYYLTGSCVLGLFRPCDRAARRPPLRPLGPSMGHGQHRAESQNTCCSGIVTHGNVFTVESSLLVVARLWSLCAEAGFSNITDRVRHLLRHPRRVRRIAAQGAQGWPREWTERFSKAVAGDSSFPSTSCTAAMSSTVTAPSSPA